MLHEADCDSTLREGSGQNGKSALVDCVARMSLPV